MMTQHKQYDLFFEEDPRITDPDFEWIDVEEVAVMPSGPNSCKRYFFHCLTDDEGLENLPFGSRIWSCIPLWMKTSDRFDPIHVFDGRENLRETNGGFDVTIT